MSTSNQELKSWVEEVSEMTKPDNIYWCNGSKEEYEEFITMTYLFTCVYVKSATYLGF